MFKPKCEHNFSTYLRDHCTRELLHFSKAAPNPDFHLHLWSPFQKTTAALVSEIITRYLTLSKDKIGPRFKLSSTNQ